MNSDIRWAKLSSSCGVITCASLLRRIRHNGKRAHKAEINDWENEGGSVAPSPTAADALVTTGSA